MHRWKIRKKYTFACFLGMVVDFSGFQAAPLPETIMFGQEGCQEGQEAEERQEAQEGREAQERQEGQAEVKYTDFTVRIRPVAPAH